MKASAEQTLSAIMSLQKASYLWPFKGGVANGTGVASFRNLYPIPTADLTTNPTLIQNPGY